MVFFAAMRLPAASAGDIIFSGDGIEYLSTSSVALEEETRWEFSRWPAASKQLKAQCSLLH